MCPSVADPFSPSQFVQHFSLLSHQLTTTLLGLCGDYWESADRLIVSKLYLMFGDWHQSIWLTHIDTDPFLMVTWWRNEMKTISALLALCAGNSPVTGEFPTQRPVTRSFDVFFDLRLNKRLSKQSWGWWFETTSLSLLRHCNVT